MKMEIGDRLLFWRNKKGISVYRLSELCGVSDTHLHTLERGEKQPTIKTLEAITDALGITLSEFFNTEDNKVTYLSEGEKRILDFYRSMPRIKLTYLLNFTKKCAANDTLHHSMPPRSMLRRIFLSCQSKMQISAPLYRQ